MKDSYFEYIIVVGCSRFGTNIATNLSLSGKDVVIIDVENNSFRKLSKSYSGFEIIGDATDIDVLINAGIKKATMLVAATNDDDVNIAVSLIAKKVFNVNKVISRLYDSEKEVAYKDTNISLIEPITLTINEFEKLIQMDESKTNVLTKRVGVC